MVEGRIEKNHIELPRRAAQIMQCISRYHDRIARPEMARILLQATCNQRRLLDHQHLGRTARERLKGQRAATGEKIETGFFIEALSEPIEHGFANPIGCRP